MHQRHEHDQHGDHVEQKRHALRRSFGDRIHGAIGHRLGQRERIGLGPPLVRNHDLGEQHRRWRAQHRGDDEMTGGIRHRRFEKLGVQHKHCPGDAGHAAGHHHEQFAA
jgi:hypothetical protein